MAPPKGLISKESFKTLGQIFVLYRIPRCFLRWCEGIFDIKNDHNFSHMYLDSIIGICNRKNSADFWRICFPACDYRKVCYSMIPRLNILLWNAKLLFFGTGTWSSTRSTLRASWKRSTSGGRATRGNQEPFAMKVIDISKSFLWGW